MWLNARAFQNTERFQRFEALGLKAVRAHASMWHLSGPKAALAAIQDAGFPVKAGLSGRTHQAYDSVFRLGSVEIGGSRLRFGLTLDARSASLQSAKLSPDFWIDPEAEAVLAGVEPGLRLGLIVRASDDPALGRRLGQEQLWLARSQERSPAAWLYEAELLMESGVQELVLYAEAEHRPGGSQHLDVGAVAWLKANSHLPVVVELDEAKPSIQLALARASLAAGADALVFRLPEAKEAAYLSFIEALSPFLTALGRPSAIQAPRSAAQGEVN